MRRDEKQLAIDEAEGINVRTRIDPAAWTGLQEIRKAEGLTTQEILRDSLSLYLAIWNGNFDPNNINLETPAFTIRQRAGQSVRSASVKLKGHS